LAGIGRSGKLTGMAKTTVKIAVALVLTCLFAAPAFAETIHVAAAISLKEALAKVAEQYKADTGEVVEFTLGSSGQLKSQIENGAPVDLFISAANQQVDDLVKAGVVDDAGRKVIAGNSLVLIVPAESKVPLDSLKGLTAAGVTRIAIGEPKSVPAGRYAEQALKRAGVAEGVKEKLVLGTNVRQVLDYVERGEVSAGLVYATDAKAAGEKVRVICTVDAADHEPIVYPAAIVKSSTRRAAAGKFLDYLLSEKGQARLKDFGFASPPHPATLPTK
jgi:molybdate transport system substrate-binding protein